jgi:kynureninase
MTEETALVMVPSVLYHTGQLLDVGRLAHAAREREIPIGIDAAHGVGSVPHLLDSWGVDFAVWCTYKYLNSGPAAPGALYVNARHFDRLPGLAGWWGSDKDRQFDMAHTFTPAADAGRWQISAPPILALAPLEASLGLFDEVGIAAVRQGSLARTDYLIDLIEGLGLTRAPYGFAIGTPRAHARRGGHVALEHPEAARIAKALKARGVVPDHRPPHIVRLAPVALYTTFEECWQVADHLRAIIDQSEHLRFPRGREQVA